MNKKDYSRLGIGFFVLLLIIMDILLVLKIHEYRDSLGEMNNSKIELKSSIDVNIELLEDLFETPANLPNFEIWNSKYNTSMNNVVNSTRLLIWISKNICSSCLIDLFEDIEKTFPTEIMERIVVVKEYNEISNIDLSALNISYFFTKSSYLDNLGHYQGAQFVLMVLDSSLRIRMVHIPISDYENRTSKYLKLIREENVLEQAN